MNALHTLQEVVQQNPLIPKASCVKSAMADRSRIRVAKGHGNKAAARAAKITALPLSEEDVDAMAEQDSEGRTFNRQSPINPHD